MMDNKLVQRFMHQVEEVVQTQADRELLFEALKRYQSSSDIKKLVQDLRKVLNEPIRLEIYDYVRPLIRPQHQQTYDKITPSAPGTKSRIIKLRRRGNESFGFAVRGGFEHGIGIFVSHVEKGSQAEQRGLKMGDEIVRVNGFTIAEAIHDEVLNLIKGRDEIELKVTCIGMVPIKQSPTDPVTWQYVDKTPLSKQQTTGAGQSEAENVTKIFINMHGAQSLGCSIVSGPKQFPGIFIETIRPGSLAEKYQLEVGDQILEVNEKSFLDIKHKEAIVELKGSKELNMVIKKHAGISLFNMKKSGQSGGATDRGQVTTEVQLHADQDSEVLEQDEKEEKERLLWEEEQQRLKKEKEIQDLKRREIERKRQEEEEKARELERQAEIERMERERKLEEERRQKEEERKQIEEEQLRQIAEQQKLEERRRKEEEKRQEEQRRIAEQKRLREKQRQQEEAEKEALRAKKQESAVLAGRSGPKSSLKPKLLGAASLSKSSALSVPDKVVKDVVLHKEDDVPLDLEIEGGIGSPLGGKIVVAGVYPGGLAEASGEIKKGDKLVKVNDHSLVDISLSEAQEILWQAEQSPQKTILLTVEESEFRNNEDETTYF